MTEIFAQRLKSARKLRGLSMADLQSLTQSKIKTSTLSRYERGEIMPSPESLIALSSALQLKPSYFQRPLKVAVDSIEYRKKSVLGRKKLAAIEEAVKHRIENYVEVENILGIHTEFSNPIEDVVIEDADDIEVAVEKLLKGWELGYNPLPNVLNQLEERSVRILEVQEVQRFEGLAMRINENIPVIVVNKAFTTEKIRFNALHELGHVVLNFKNFGLRQIEKACHRFAGAMLFPRECVWAEFGRVPRTHLHIHELLSVNKFYGISCQAALLRAVDIGIIPGHQIKRHYQKYFNHNREERGLSNYDYEERTLKLEQLVARAEASGLINVNKAADLLSTSIEQYLKLGTADEDPELSQSAFLSSMNSYYDDDEDDYSDVPIIEHNPDYEGWRYLQGGTEA